MENKERMFNYTFSPSADISGIEIYDLVDGLSTRTRTGILGFCITEI